METSINGCQQCGTCCIKGGPALHKEDIDLVKSGKIPITSLITIRRGELVYKPHRNEPEEASCELIKISGLGREWQCRFFSAGLKSCSIYADRPISCRKLECWNTAEIEQLVEKDTLDRFDIVNASQPIFSHIKKHEEECKYPELSYLADVIEQQRRSDLDILEKLVNTDIHYRTSAVNSFGISLAEELFYFGRPLFQFFQQLGFTISEDRRKLKLTWPEC